MSGMEGTIFEKIQTGLLGEVLESGFGQVHRSDLSRFVGLAVLDPAQEKA
jgi:hypothetical protein